MHIKHGLSHKKFFLLQGQTIGEIQWQGYKLQQGNELGFEDQNQETLVSQVERGHRTQKGCGWL